MQPGTLHWVLGTANTICAGQHFYASSTIRHSVISLIHTLLLASALTNESKSETQTLLYQMMHFWSMHINKRDVNSKLGWYCKHVLWCIFNPVQALISPTYPLPLNPLMLFILASSSPSPMHSIPCSMISQRLCRPQMMRSPQLNPILFRWFTTSPIITSLSLTWLQSIAGMLSNECLQFAAMAMVFSEAIAEFQGGDMDMNIDGLENKGKEADVIPFSKVKSHHQSVILRWWITTYIVWQLARSLHFPTYSGGILVRILDCNQNFWNPVGTFLAVIVPRQNYSRWTN